jgi:uncharacterized protein (TIGR03663 family)
MPSFSKRRFDSDASPFPQSFFAIILIVAMLGLGMGLRFVELGKRPIHVDEAATGAQILADYIETGSYDFDPHHYHGPLLPFVAAIWSKVKDQTSWVEMEAVTLRQVTAACGVLTMVGVLFLQFGLWRSVVGIGFLGTSPLLVYYSRMYIHEPLFLLCALPALAGLLYLFAGRSKWLAAGLLGLGVGLMAATRETVVISVAAWAAAGLLALARDRSAYSRVQVGLMGPFSCAVGLAILIIVVGYSAAGQGLGGVLDFLRTYTDYETTPGHEKPFIYYLHMLAWPKLSAGRWWTEIGILILAACVYLGKRDERGYLASRFLFESGVLHLLIYSLIAYKTPWLVSLGWMQLCLAAACGLGALWNRFSGKPRLAIAFIFAVMLGWQGIQAHRAAFRLSSDGRNPYAYVPTVSDVVTIPNLLWEIAEHVPETNTLPLAIIGESYWPLPWYLRESGDVGYYDKLPEAASSYPILILMPSVFEAGSDNLESTHTFIPKGLRDDFPIIIAVENAVWSRYQASP